MNSILSKFFFAHLCITFKLFICGTLSDLVPFIQIKKCEKHPWRSVTFIKVAGLKVTLLHGCFHLVKIVQMVLNQTKIQMYTFQEFDKFSQVWSRFHLKC